MPVATPLSLQPADVAADLVAMLAAHTNNPDLQAQAQEAIEGRAWADLVGLAAPAAAGLLGAEASAASDEVVDSAYALLGRLLHHAGVSAAEQVAAQVSGDSEQRKQLRLQVLVGLHNVGGDEAVRGALFSATVAYASATGQIARLGAFLDGVEDTPYASEALYRQLQAAFAAAGMPERAQTAGLKLLRLYEDAAASGDPAGAADVAAGCVAIALQQPVGADADAALVRGGGLLQLRAVAALEGHAEHGPLFALLRVVATGTYADFQALGAAPALLQKHGIDADALASKMRLLTLVAAAAGQQSLGYQEVAAALDVPPADVEKWVVGAVSAGLLEVRMDQPNQRIEVQRCAHAAFSEDQWSDLQAKLHAWRDNVAGILETIRAARASA